MTSQIVRTNPTAGTATTSSVRNNFGYAADEINRLLRASTDKVVATGTDSVVANFSNVPTFVLADGVRVLIEIANTTTSATPTLNVNSSGAKSIKKSDGSSLAIGDLVAGGYYEFVYDSGSTEWKVLNVSAITSQDALLTTILGGLYPVGGLLTTTLATDPGTADYFFSGITFGTWEAYAQGRTIVGIDTGTAITLASSTSNVVTLTVASHSLSAGDLIAVSGFTSDTDANGEFTVDSTTSTTIVYTATNVSDGTLTGSSLLVKNAAFDTAQEVGGEASHTQTESEVAGHRHNLFADSQGQNTNYLSKSEFASATSVVDGSIYSYAMRANAADTDATRGLSSEVKDSSGDSVTQTATNNLQPYITTYIWKRVVTP
jgi:hypothetical protein